MLAFCRELHGPTLAGQDEKGIVTSKNYTRDALGANLARSLPICLVKQHSLERGRQVYKLKIAEGDSELKKGTVTLSLLTSNLLKLSEVKVS